ncbi:MAG: hypothetical protein P8J87_08460, partial [Verrucomicrobiales bacterium]|nr:hypothetical protein [Verrucomicrobiales bacterium]
LRGFSSLDEETAGRNVELLITTRISRWRVVIGKWLVICSQGWLILVSLLPYFIVRYFFGGLDIAQNILALVMLLAANAATTAVVIGASGYQKLAPRLSITIGSMAILSLITPLLAGAGITALNSIGNSAIQLWFPWITALCAIVIFATYTIYGLQLGRARLRFSLRPYELPSSRLVVTLIFVTPFILLFGIPCFVLPGIAACALLAYLVLRLDTPITPPKPAFVRTVSGSIAPPPPPPPTGLPRPTPPAPPSIPKDRPHS